jgi:hypothetical protein
MAVGSLFDRPWLSGLVCGRSPRTTEAHLSALTSADGNERNHLPGLKSGSTFSRPKGVV